MKNDKLAKHLQFFVAWQMAGLPSLQHPDKSLDDCIEEMYDKYMHDDVYRNVLKRFEITIQTTGVDFQYTPSSIPQGEAELVFMALISNPPGGDDLCLLVRNLLCSVYAEYLYTLVYPQADASKCIANATSAAEKIFKRRLELRCKPERPDGTYAFKCHCGAEKLYNRFDAAMDIPSQTEISVIDGHVSHLIKTLAGSEEDIITNCYDFMNFVCPSCGRTWESEADLLNDGVLVYKHKS